MALIQYLTAIEFDHGALTKLAEQARALNIGRPLVVTDQGLAASPLFARVLGIIEPLRPVVFDGTRSNPDEESVEAAVEAYRAHACDGIVAVGGGSPIDLAKAVALLATHDGPLAQYAFIEGGFARITARVAPVIAVPTTAGTGSEVGRAALITLRDGRKLGFLSPHLIPRLALCDPELTLGLPAGLTAATGMDALTHCVETYLSPRVNPPADAIALDGAVRAATWIERAYASGDDRDARWHMMMASLQGGLTFQKGLGAVHAMSHPLGGLRELRLHHGTLNAVILPAVLRFNRSHAAERIGTLERALGLAPGVDLATHIERLNERLALPACLADMGVTAAMLPAMVEGAVRDHSNATNPRPASREDYEMLFQQVLHR